MLLSFCLGSNPFNTNYRRMFAIVASSPIALPSTPGQAQAQLESWQPFQDEPNWLCRDYARSRFAKVSFPCLGFCIMKTNGEGARINMCCDFFLDEPRWDIAGDKHNSNHVIWEAILGTAYIVAIERPKQTYIVHNSIYILLSCLPFMLKEWRWTLLTKLQKCSPARRRRGKGLKTLLDCSSAAKAKGA